VRAGFRTILSTEPDLEVVGEAGDGLHALRASSELRPDVVLMDVRMPVMDRLEATRRLTSSSSPGAPQVLVLTTFDLDEYVFAALRAGACGFLLKDAGPRLLVEAVRAAAAGDALVSPSVTVRLLEHLARPERPEPPDVPLSPREVDVVRAVARGRTNAEIAAELFVSLSTVKTHLTNVQNKLTARNRTEIAIWAWEHGLVR